MHPGISGGNTSWFIPSFVYWDSELETSWIIESADKGRLPHTLSRGALCGGWGGRFHGRDNGRDMAVGNTRADIPAGMCVAISPKQGARSYGYDAPSAKWADSSGMGSGTSGGAGNRERRLLRAFAYVGERITARKLRMTQGNMRLTPPLGDGKLLNRMICADAARSTEERGQP